MSWLSSNWLMMPAIRTRTTFAKASRTKQQCLTFPPSELPAWHFNAHSSLLFPLFLRLAAQMCVCVCLCSSRYHGEGPTERSPVAMAPAGQQVYTAMKIKTSRPELAESGRRARLCLMMPRQSAKTFLSAFP